MDKQRNQLVLQKARVFLSYAKEDKDKVKSLYKRLLKEQLNPWIDLADLRPGQDWNEAILNAIRNARFVIVFLSSRSTNKRGYVQKEIREALDVASRMPERDLFIIPARIEDCMVPSSLTKWHWIDVHRKGGFKRLVNSIKDNLGLGSETNPSKDHKRAKPMSEDELAETILTKAFSFGGSFMEAKLASGEIVVCNSHFMDFRQSVPSVWIQAKRDYPPSRPLTPKMVSYAMPAKTRYRKRVNVVKEIRPIPSERSGYVLVAKGGKRCGIFRLYMHYIQLKYPNGTIYLTGPSTPIVVEEEGRVRFVVAPFNVSSTILNSN